MILNRGIGYIDYVNNLIEVIGHIAFIFHRNKLRKIA